MGSPKDAATGRMVVDEQVGTEAASLGFEPQGRREVVVDIEVGRAVARGGPLDGRVLGDADAASYEVRLTDRTTWTYVATDERETLPDGSTAIVFVSCGRGHR